jgi:methionyl-tRNA formyltransferase
LLCFQPIKMKVVVFVKRDLSANMALNMLVPELKKQGHEIIVFLADRVRKSERSMKHANEMMKIERDLLVDYFERFDRSHDTLPENLNGKLLTFLQICEYYGCEMHEVKNANSPDFVEKVKQMEPDVGLNIRNNMIYKKPIIDVFPRGLYNTHLGPLPRYAGLYGAFRQMMNGEKEAGCAFHQIDEGIDTGGVIGISYIPIDPTKSVLWHQNFMYQEGVKIFLKTLPKLKEGVSPQDLFQTRTGEIEYYGQPSEEEFEEFEARGLKLADRAEFEDFISQYYSYDLISQ